MLLAAAVAILTGVVAVAMGWGGEMVAARRDLPATPLSATTASDVAMLRLPAGLFGYQREATDSALEEISCLVASLDGEIARLREEVWRLTEADRGGQLTASDPRAALTAAAELAALTAGAGPPTTAGAGPPTTAGAEPPTTAGAEPPTAAGAEPPIAGAAQDGGPATAEPACGAAEEILSGSGQASSQPSSPPS